MSRTPRAARKDQDKQPAMAGEPRPRQILVWRTCPVCDWDDQVVESENADPTCPRCQATTELVAMAPVPPGGAPRESDVAPRLEHRDLAHHERARGAKQRKR